HYNHSSLHVQCSDDPRDLHSFPTRRSSDLAQALQPTGSALHKLSACAALARSASRAIGFSFKKIHGPAFHLCAQSVLRAVVPVRSEEHTSELQSLTNLVCRLLLEKKKSP